LILGLPAEATITAAGVVSEDKGKRSALSDRWHGMEALVLPLCCQ
jgi:hypothetical protein